MADHTLELNENAPTVESTDAPEVPKSPYVVTAEAGLFKRGQQYNQGDVIELDEATANRFIELGEVAPQNTESEAPIA